MYVGAGEKILYSAGIKKEWLQNQRQLLIDIILQDECCCCKEIYYQAIKKDPTIGMATVYRMVKTLEETGLIKRKNLYRIQVEEESA